MKLIIGNKNYSSWSLRAWLALKLFDIPFEEVRLELFSHAFYDTLKHHSPAGKVPVLVDNGLDVWDSLAICEYVNERYLDGAGLPSDPSVRAIARSVMAEMHAEYGALRNEMPMNCRANRTLDVSQAALSDIASINSLWSRLLKAHGGPYLFGNISLVDAFFAPVVFRFNTYHSPVSAVAQDYINTMLELPAMKTWLADSIQETAVVDVAEVGQRREQQ